MDATHCAAGAAILVGLQVVIKILHHYGVAVPLMEILAKLWSVNKTQPAPTAPTTESEKQDEKK